MKFGGQPTPWSEVEIENLRLRNVSQILIQEIGTAGPENAEESARRACGVIQRMADQIVSADARIAELEQSVELARRDADRYRWLRECDMEGDRAVHIGDELMGGALLDAAIDAARAGNGKGGYAGK